MLGETAIAIAVEFRPAAEALVKKGYLSRSTLRDTYRVRRVPEALCRKCFLDASRRARADLVELAAARAAERQVHAEAAAARRLERAEAAAARRLERAEAARRAEELKNPWIGASHSLGLDPPAEHFECPDCGRWASTTHSEEALNAIIDRREPSLGVATDGANEPGYLTAVAVYASIKPIRPASIQSTWGVTYENATELIDAAQRLGLIEPKGKAFVRAAALCGYCYERRDGLIDERERQRSVRDPIPAQLRFRVLQRDGFRCIYCGRGAREGVTLHLDHLVPFSAGGATTEDNLVTACLDCNLGKSGQTILPD